jgi:hypothetical protein
VWAVVAYLSAVVLLVGPLIIYFVMKNRSPFIRFHAAQSFNIQLTCLIYEVISLLLAAITAQAQLAISYLFIPFPIFLGGALFVLIVTAAIGAAKGATLRSPRWFNLPVLR